MNMKRVTFKDLFPKPKPIIAMIHLAEDRRGKIRRAMEELELLVNEKFDGAIIEDYSYGSTTADVNEALEKANQEGFGKKIILGINLLSSRYHSFDMANDYDAKFIQIDSVQTPDLDIPKYDLLREKYPKVVVLGGVGFKYTKPTGNPLEVDLREGKSRCEAIVTTGPGTGIETPTDKLKNYKDILGDFPLIVGAGVNIRNLYSQLSVADGAIIGSYIKNGDTEAPIDKFLVASIVKEVNRVRKSILKS